MGGFVGVGLGVVVGGREFAFAPITGSLITAVKVPLGLGGMLTRSFSMFRSWTATNNCHCSLDNLRRLQVLGRF